MNSKIIPYNPKLREFAKQLRNNSTLSEVLLWKQIKGKALGVEFKRQVPMLEYIVDFYCQEIGLAIEVDGNIHDFRYLEDAQRQQEIEKYGVIFIRFSNEEIKNNMFSVILSLESKIEELKAERGVDNK
jgi:DNA methylase, putative